MLRCKICKVPLSGFLSKISKVLFRITPSAADREICSKCSDQPEKKKAKRPSDDSASKKYECKLCGRMIHEENSLEHIKAEEYLIELIRKDHAHWHHKDPTCQECIDYYRRLVKENEI